MIGWSITITRTTPEQYQRSLMPVLMLADWKVGAMGTRWIDELVERGEAEQVKSGGYPDIYTAPAGSVASLLLGKEPPSGEDVTMRKPRDAVIEWDELAACPDDEVLTIVVWDQS